MKPPAATIVGASFALLAFVASSFCRPVPLFIVLVSPTASLVLVNPIPSSAPNNTSQAPQLFPYEAVLAAMEAKEFAIKQAPTVRPLEVVVAHKGSPIGLRQPSKLRPEINKTRLSLRQRLGPKAPVAVLVSPTVVTGLIDPAPPRTADNTSVALVRLTDSTFPVAVKAVGRLVKKAPTVRPLLVLVTAKVVMQHTLKST